MLQVGYQGSDEELPMGEELSLKDIRQRLLGITAADRACLGAKMSALRTRIELLNNFLEELPKEEADAISCVLADLFAEVVWKTHFVAITPAAKRRQSLARTPSEYLDVTQHYADMYVSVLNVPVP